MNEILKKLCTKCKIEKDISMFELRSDTGKYRTSCRKCVNSNRNLEKTKKIKKNNYEKNKQKILEYNKINYPKIKEKRNKNRQQLRKYEENYRIKNLKKIRNYRNKYKKSKRENDFIYKLKENIGNLIRNSFKKRIYNKNSKTHKILGCSCETFKLHVESKFESWMNWENYGKYNGEYNYGWDIDHIIPISSASSEADVYKLNDYKNFQPLCSKVNRDIKRNNMF